MNKHVIILSMFVITAIGLSVVQIIFSALFTTAGLELSQIQSEKDALQQENMILSEKLYSLASLTSIAEKAKQLGFVDQDAKSRIVLTGQSSFALKP